MTLREEFEQHKKNADLFYARMNKLEESLQNFSNHIDKVVKNDARSKAEILSAIEKLCFEMDCDIEAAREYADLLTDRVLYIGEYKFPKDLASLINRLPGIITSASVQIGKIFQQREYEPQALRTRADSLVSSLTDIIETPNNQIKALEVVISNIQTNFASMQEQPQHLTNAELTRLFDDLYKRYAEEESEHYKRFEQQIIRPDVSLSDLYNKARNNDFVSLYRDVFDESKFLRDGLKKGLTELELLSVFDYKVQEQILKALMTSKDNTDSNKPEENTNDSLVRFIFNDKERKKVRMGLQACEDTGQVAAFVRRLNIEEVLQEEDLRSIDFRRTIIPILKFETTEKAIKEAILKQLKKGLFGVLFFVP